ncbi:MAG: hypothetical protein QM784_07235 [Polyangiaceae bacterium]
MLIGKLIRSGLALGAIASLGTAVACSSDDSSSSKRSYGDLVAAIESPTGTLDATSANPVAKEYEKINSSSLNGTRGVQSTTDSSSQLCTAGGSAKGEASGGQSSGDMDFVYDSCCIEASCCVDGTVHMVYKSDSQSTASFSYCMDMDYTMNCDSQTVTTTAAGCLGPNGFVYAITIDGKSYAVTGSYSNGTGQLTIKGANGSFTCTYTSGAGTCTDESGGTFSF